MGREIITVDSIADNETYTRRIEGTLQVGRQMNSHVKELEQ
jgi:hypothetical protein